VALAVGRPGEQPPPGFPRHGLCTNRDSYEHRHITRSIRAPADPNGGAEGSARSLGWTEGKNAPGRGERRGMDGGW